MIKEKIKKIIYRDELTEEEKESFCYYYTGDRYDYGVYGAGWEFIDDFNERECYKYRKEELIEDIKKNGADEVLNLRFFEDDKKNQKLNNLIINYIKEC